jgi:hypothetical protein
MLHFSNVFDPLAERQRQPETWLRGLRIQEGVATTWARGPGEPSP